MPGSSVPLWLLATLPWVAFPVLLAWRGRERRDLSEYAVAVPSGGATERVSVVIPARNEARNIEPCMRSILATTWPQMELLVVNDNSDDGTGVIARRVAADDPRVTVIDAPPLPAGWFGKQWACHQAVVQARGGLLFFTDADTRHRPELIARMIGAMRARGADMLSIAGQQLAETFWERLMQPQLFTMIVLRYRSVEWMSRSTNPLDKIVNGQCFMLSRAAYDAAGGHERVRENVAEDLRMAQEVCRTGGSVQMLEGPDFIATRMYEGLGELMRGWGKNVYAAGRDTVPLGPLGQAILRVAYPWPALWNVVPFVAAVLAMAGVFSTGVLWWGLICYLAFAVFEVAVMRISRVSIWYAFLHPLAGVMMFVLFGRAAWRGSRVEWKGRKYRSVAEFEKARP
ncbi:MAG: glycosyltransferase [Gemmatimonadota bacterium]|nr:glycosyltransferase [Gemmatimonadota bacterium]